MGVASPFAGSNGAPHIGKYPPIFFTLFVIPFTFTNALCITREHTVDMSRARKRQKHTLFVDSHHSYISLPLVLYLNSYSEFVTRKSVGIVMSSLQLRMIEI